MRWMLAAIAMSLLAGVAVAEDRALSLYHTHTGKSATIVFKRDGKYDAAGIAELNGFLADWRNGKQAEMDPALFDLLWTVYGDVGATKPIHIVSSYRSPETNAMLRANSSGVAENSQHMRGKAMDFFIPGIRLADLRAAAMKRQGGGVGYYPTSGSPFVHLDTGSVRAWPRMTTAQLKAIFPTGQTAHLPSDGPPLAGHDIAVAALQTPKPTDAPLRKGRTLIDLLFGGTTPSQPEVVGAAIPERLAPSPAGLPLAVDAVLAPTPRIRPAHLGTDERIVVAEAPMPRPDRREVQTVGGFEIAVVDDAYPLMGYAPGEAATVRDEDPFAFVETLGGMEGGAAIGPSPVFSGLDGYWHSTAPLDGAPFAMLTAPDHSDLSMLLAPMTDGVPAHFENRRPRRF